MARPTALTPEVQHAIVDALEKGSTWEGAARAGGVTIQTVAFWKREGRKGREPFLSFLEETTAACSRVEIAVVNCFLVAAKTDWKAALAYLERRFWREWWLSKPGKGAKKEPGAMNDEELAQALFTEFMRRAMSDPKMASEALKKLMAAGVSPEPEKKANE